MDIMPTYGITVEYEVKYKWYKYNSGRGDNGYVVSSVFFCSEREAREFIKNPDIDFEGDGYFEEIVALICHTEHKMDF